MSTIMNKERVRDVFRDYVLEALDEASRDTFDPPRNDAGATDADLPRIFKMVDEQVKVLADRYQVTLIDEEDLPHGM